MRSFIPALLFFLGLALALRIDLYLTIAWFLIGLYVLAKVWSRRAARSLRVHRAFPTRAFNGDRVTVELTLRNESRLPVPWVEVEESVPVELRDASAPPVQAMSVVGRGQRTWTYTLTCRQRGHYRLGPLRLQTGDLLGIEQQILLLREPRHLTVYPRIVSLDQLGLPTRSALTALPSRTPLFEDPTRIMGVRSYQAGDSLRRIHWPATARTGNLLVKQYQPAIARDTHICLDLCLRDYVLRDRHAATEMAIVAAASLAHHIVVRENLPAGLSVLGLIPPSEDEAPDANATSGRAGVPVTPPPSISFPPRAERQHLIEILETLARVAVTSEGDFPALVRRESLNLQWGTTLLAIVGQVEEGLAETLLYLRRTGHAVGVLVVQPGYLAPLDRTGLPGIPVHRVWQDRDLEALA